MYAVIETGGKQHIVELGTELEVELLDAEPGQEINLERVLFVADGDETSVGRPVVENAAVTALVLRQDRGEKTISFKYRPKARRRVKKGHRQELTVLRITDVRLGDRSAAAEAEAEEEKQAGERERIREAAERQAAEDKALAEKLAARTKQPAETAAEPEAEAEAKPKRGRGRAKAEAAAAPEETPAEAETAAEDADESGPGAESATADASPEAADETAPKKRARTKKDE